MDIPTDRNRDLLNLRAGQRVRITGLPNDIGFRESVDYTLDDPPTGPKDQVPTTVHLLPERKSSVTGKVMFLRRPAAAERLMSWDGDTQTIYIHPDMTLRYGEVRRRIRLGRTYQVTASDGRLTVKRNTRPLLCRLGFHRGAEWTSGANYWWCARCETSPSWPPY